MNKTIGILRKTNYQNAETAPELLVFGYQSKLYRDDVKALEFDREAHLIPAPFAPKDLMISRLISSHPPIELLIKLYCMCNVHWIT
jgi:hypothetical protein